MSTVKVSTDAFLEKKSEIDTLDPVLEVNENVASEIFDRPYEEGDYEEISPRVFSLKDVTEPLTLEALDNAIYELGVVNLCWPEISEPVFETRTSFPKSYYTNTRKERLLLAYAENFRRQYNFHFKFSVRKPLLLQVPNECGLQKMVCSSIRPTKLCFVGTNTWQGVASLVSDYFDYEPLTKPMLHENSSTVEDYEVASTSYAVPKTKDKKLKRKSEDELMQLAADRLRQKPDEYENWALSCAADLKKMEPTQQIFAKSAIAAIIMEGQLGLLHRNSVKINTPTVTITPSPTYTRSTPTPTNYSSTPSPRYFINYSQQQNSELSPKELPHYQQINTPSITPSPTYIRSTPTPTNYNNYSQQQNSEIPSEEPPHYQQNIY